MANRLVTSVALLGFFAWSMLGLLALGLVTLGSGILRFVVELLFTGSADAATTAEEIGHFLQALGGGVVVFAWVTGSIVIAIGATIFNRMSVVAVHGARFDWQPKPWHGREMKDVTPRRDDGAAKETPRLPRPHDKD